jgi:very-short-patch-repair endonuclease
VNLQVAGYEVDFLWSDERLIVETDGREDHLTVTAFEEDRARDAFLATLGYRVLRFSRRQVLYEPELVARSISSTL